MIFKRNKSFAFFHAFNSVAKTKVYLQYDLVHCLFPKCCPLIRVYMFFVILSCNGLLYVSSKVSYISSFISENNVLI